MNLSEHQERLLCYAFDERVPLAALTDGLIRWLYLPTIEGSWEQRRLHSIDLHQQNATRAASALHRFLSRAGLVGGAALRLVPLKSKSQERTRRVRLALKQAWQRVIHDPQGLLRDLLAETAEEISGHLPDPGTVTEFARKQPYGCAPSAPTTTSPPIVKGSGRNAIH